MKIMKIEVWSDYVCPFCYIGKRHLEQALEQFSHKDQVEVTYMSYELDPNSPKDFGKSYGELLAAKYGMSAKKAKRTLDGITQRAASAGLTYKFDKMIPTNTFDAHRLTKFAKRNGKETEMTETLLSAFFTEGKHIGDRETLADLAASIGLDREEALNTLHDEKAYENEVRADQQMARQIGIKGVPFFVINEKYALSGAQPVEAFAEALQKVWEEEKQSPILEDISSEESASCEDGNCVIPEKE